MGSMLHSLPRGEAISLCTGIREGLEKLGFEGFIGFVRQEVGWHRRDEGKGHSWAEETKTL